VPDGVTHDKITTAMFPVAVLIGAATGDPVVFVASYALEYIVNPDLDQPGLTRAEGHVMRSLGCFAAPWVGYWTMYGVIFKRWHRSAITHFPVLSTLFRLVYLLAIPACYYKPLLGFIQAHWVAILLGLSLGDAFHYIADLLSGELKRKRRRRKKR